MARDRLEHRAASRGGARRRRPSPRPARSAKPSSRSSCWSFAHCGTLSPGFGSVRPAVSAGESNVGIQTIRAPSRAAISTASAFIPPTAAVQRDRPDRAHARHDRGDDLRPLRRRRVVRLQPEAGEPELGEAVRERDVVDRRVWHVRADVDVQVVRAPDELRAVAAVASALRSCSSRFATSPEQRTRARLGDPRLDPELEQQVARRLHLVHAPDGVRLAADRAAGRAAAARSPRRSPASATRRGRRPRPPDALDRRGGEALHEDGAEELQRRRVAGARRRRRRPACRAARARRRTPARPPPDASAGVASPRTGTGPSRATSANRSSPTSSATSRFSAGAAVFRSA